MKIIYLIFYLTLFLLPFQNAFMGIEIGVISFNVFSIGILIVFGLSLINLLLSASKYHISMVDIFMTLFAITFMVSTILAQDSFRASHMAYKAIFLPFVTYFVIKFLINTEEQFTNVIKVLITGITLMACLSVIQTGGLGKRLYAFGLDPLGIATYVIMPMITITVMGWWKNKYGAVALLVSTIAFILTFGRVYFVGIICGPIIYLAIKRGHILKIFTFMFPICIIFIISLSLNRDIFRHKYVNTANLKTIERITNLELYKRSLYFRARQYNEGLTNFYKKPILGTGLQRGKHNVTIHNFHIEWLEYGGVIAYTIGTGIFFWFFLLQKQPAMQDKMTTALLSLIIIVLLNCFTNGIMHGVNPTMLFLLMGLAEGRRNLVDPPSETTTPVLHVARVG